MTDADALREAMARAAVLVMAEARYERLCAIREDGVRILLYWPYDTDETRPPLDSYEPTRDQEAARVVDAALSAAKAAGYALVPVEATEKARETLRMAAETFRKYEQLHRDKGTDEGQAKANSNMIIAQLCEKAHAAMIAAAKEKP